MAMSQSGGRVSLGGRISLGGRTSLGGVVRRKSALFGSPPRLTFSGGMFSSSGATANSDFLASSGHMSGPITSSRPPSALDIRFDDEV